SFCNLTMAMLMAVKVEMNGTQEALESLQNKPGASQALQSVVETIQNSYLLEDLPIIGLNRKLDRLITDLSATERAMAIGAGAWAQEEASKIGGSDMPYQDNYGMGLTINGSGYSLPIQNDSVDSLCTKAKDLDEAKVRDIIVG